MTNVRLLKNIRAQVRWEYFNSLIYFRLREIENEFGLVQTELTPKVIAQL